MPKVSRSVLVGFSAKQMYALVNDVARYPEFLPGCVGSQVVQQDEQSMIARVDVRKAGIGQSFTTKNSLIIDQRIGMQLADGPFKQLQGAWQFTALTEEACKVEFELQFEFSSPIVALAFGKVFQQLVESMVNAFIARAKIVYGN